LPSFLRPSIKHLRSLSSVLRTTDWIVRLLEPLPDPIASLPFYGDRVDGFSMMANQISFPQIQSNVQEVSISGFKVRVPVDTEFSGTITVTFHETVKAEVIRSLWAWQKAIEDPNTKKKAGRYKANMVIYPHSPVSKEGPNRPLPREEIAVVNVPVAYKLYGVAIAGLSLPDFSGDKVGEIVRPTATFSYDWMDIVKENFNVRLSF